MIKKIYDKIYKVISHPNQYAKKVGVKLGNNIQLNTKSFGSEPYLITLGDDLYTSANVTFITHDGSVNVLRNLYEECDDVDLIKPIKVGNNVFLGFGVVILPGATIGDNVIVGANSLVKGTLKENCVYAGNPIREICSIKDFYNKRKCDFLHTKKLSKEDKKQYLEREFNG
ncbi:acyltransferase [Photobacterium aquae]|nr:acyltransferase [Photobacterium aquae]